jgi:hypothetical protein
MVADLQDDTPIGARGHQSANSADLACGQRKAPSHLTNPPLETAPLLLPIFFSFVNVNNMLERNFYRHREKKDAPMKPA